MNWLSFFTGAGRAAAKESSAAAKMMSRSAAEMAEQATRVAATDAAQAEKLVQMSTKLSEAAEKAGTAAKGVKMSNAEKLAAAKLYGAGGLVLYGVGNKAINGKGFLSSATDMVLDDPKEGEGLGGNVWRQLVGDKAADKSLMGAGVDTVFGDGTYDGSVAMLRNGGNAVGNTFSGISDTLQGFLHRAGGPGMPYPSNQYYDASYYNVVANPQNYAGLSGDRAFMQQVSLLNGGSGGFLSHLNALTGKNNINAFNLAEMALAAFLTFGPFGKIAKIGGLLLGANSYKSMSVEREQQKMLDSLGVKTQQQLLQQLRESDVNSPYLQQPMVEEEPENIVYRSRSI